MFGKNAAPKKPAASTFASNDKVGQAVPPTAVEKPRPLEARRATPEITSNVRPPASPSTRRLRHTGLLISFFLIVCLPLIAAIWYLNVRAADQYASYLGFSVRTEESSSAVEILGGITELSGSSSSDTDILFAYLTSHELVRRIDDDVDLRGIWSRVSTRQDPVFAYNPDGTIEDLVEYWEGMVRIVYDNGSGMLDLRVLSFDPTDSHRIADALLKECALMINNLSAVAREDAIKYAREELDVALDRLKNARQGLTAFRNRTQIVDPTIDTQSRMGLLTTLQQQLAASLIALDLLADTTRDNDPRAVQAQRRVEVIEKRIDAERRKLGLGANAQGSDVFAALVGEYEGLIVDREFAEKAYTSALAAFDGAQAEARKQSRYLAAHIRPTLAERAEYPERGTVLMIISIFLLFGWAILALIYYSLRDRR